MLFYSCLSLSLISYQKVVIQKGRPSEVRSEGRGLNFCDNGQCPHTKFRENPYLKPRIICQFPTRKKISILWKTCTLSRDMTDLRSQFPTFSKFVIRISVLPFFPLITENDPPDWSKIIMNSNYSNLQLLFSQMINDSISLKAWPSETNTLIQSHLIELKNTSLFRKYLKKCHMRLRYGRVTNYLICIISKYRYISHSYDKDSTSHTAV